MTISDADKCRVIAEWEGLALIRVVAGRKTVRWAFENGKPLPDYANDLNATMQAAQKLPGNFRFHVHLFKTKAQAVVDGIPGYAWHIIRKGDPVFTADADTPARAAFEALYSYIVAQKETR